MSRMDQQQLNTNSQIFFTKSAGSQTDHLLTTGVVEPSITLPLSHYDRLASVYYCQAYKSIQSHGKTVDHLMNYTDSCCQTDPLIDLVRNDTMTHDVIITSKSMNLVDLPDVIIIDDELSMNNEPIESSVTYKSSCRSTNNKNHHVNNSNTKEGSCTFSSSNKRQRPFYEDHSAPLKKYNTNGRHIVQEVAKRFETLATTDSTLDSIKTIDDIIYWCVRSLIRNVKSIENYYSSGLNID